MIRIMIADDERHALDELARLVEEDKDFQLVAKVNSGTDALRKLEEEDIDAVILDIEMPGATGLEVAGQLANWEVAPLVVFATAYHQYAIEAFEANAIDYILKPYDPARMKKALEKIKVRLKEEKQFRDKLISLEDDLIRRGVVKKLIGQKRNARDRIVIDPQEVYYFHAHYAELVAHLENQELIVRSTLKEIAATLDPAMFAQTHKSYIVNINRIEKVCPMFSGNFQITLKCAKAERIPLSRRYANHLKKLLGGHW